MKKRILSLLLIVMMIVGILPLTTLTAFAADDLIWPVDSSYYITCMYYYKSGQKHSTKYDYRYSMDIGGSGNILAVESGVVEVATNLGNTSFGKYVIIKHNSGYRSLYAHLASYSVSVGQSVTKGQKIGVMGSTGNSGGVHLHFEYSGGDPWKMFYNEKYMEKISFEQNVRSNNATYNSDKTVVNVIDTYYYKSGTNYYYSHTHSYTGNYSDTEHPHKVYKKCSCGSKQYTGATSTSASCVACAFEEDGIAVNAKYTISGNGSGHSQYTAKLTDDVADTALSFDNKWFAFYYNKDAAASAVNAPNGIGSVTIDLGKFYSLSEVKMNLINDTPSGIAAPKAINIYTSNDGKNFTKSASVSDIGKSEKTAYICSAKVSGTAKYVKVEFELSGMFAFLNEIKVYGTETEEPEDLGLTNIALNKTYTGGNAAIIDSNGSPAAHNAKLTDGTAINAIDYNGGWLGLWYNKDATIASNNAPNGVATIVVDLKNVYDGIEKVKLNLWLGDTVSGIAAPKSIKVAFSKDGQTYTNDTTVAIPAGVSTAAWASVAVNNVSARYVKFTIETQATWTFLNEIQVLSNGENISDDQTSEPEVSEPEVSEPEISEPEVSEPETPVVPNADNIAFGKDYIGADATSVSTYSASLTDGKANPVGAFDQSWFAFYYNKDADSDKINAPDGIGTIIIDLEELKNGITDVRVHVWNCNANGILPAKSIGLFVSEDGINYTEIGDLSIPASDEPAWATISTDNISAQYVKLVVETQAVWTFLNEVEVYADPNYVPDGETSEPEVSDPEVSEPSDDSIADVDNDNDVDAADYVLVKRAVLNTYELTEQQKAVADVDKDGDVDATDYVLIKRIVLGTYTVK